MEAVERVERIISPALAEMGYEVVRVRFTGGSRRTLQIMAERRDRRAISVDDCAEISRVVSALLDVEDPIAGSYLLEVSSPGIDRPLVRPRDFERFAGFEARIELRYAIDGRRRFRGRLLGLADGMVCLATAQGEMRVPFDDIECAKLVLTDELLAAAGAAASDEGQA